MSCRLLRLGIAALALGTVLPAAAADQLILESGDGMFQFRGGFGVLSLEANEIVYAGPTTSNKLSHLIWQSTAPMVAGAMNIALPDGWSLAARAQVAMSGGSYMEDYDWFGPDWVSYDPEDWTHRSQHDATNLDWYFNGSVLLGRDFELDNGYRINLNGGFKYTDVQWAAFGGSYVYSDSPLADHPGDHFREHTGTESDSEAAITYRQSFPALVAGINFAGQEGPLSFNAGLQSGFTIQGAADDQHWMTAYHFVDDLGSAPLLGVNLTLGYEVADGMNLFLEGTMEKIFTGRGNEYVYDLIDDTLAIAPDMGGGDLFAASFSGGIKGTF